MAIPVVWFCWPWFSPCNGARASCACAYISLRIPKEASFTEGKKNAILFLKSWQLVCVAVGFMCFGSHQRLWVSCQLLGLYTLSMLKCSELSAIITSLPPGDFSGEIAISNKSPCAICEAHRGSAPRIFLKKCGSTDMNWAFDVNRWAGEVFNAQAEPTAGIICRILL